MIGIVSVSVITFTTDGVHESCGVMSTTMTTKMMMMIVLVMIIMVMMTSLMVRTEITTKLK